MSVSQPSSERITELAGVIAANTAIVSKWLADHGHAPLSNEEGSLSKPPIPEHATEVVQAQEAVVAATQELHMLMKGPSESLLGLCVSQTFPLCKIWCWMPSGANGDWEVQQGGGE